MYWVSILAGRVVECGVHFFLVGRGPLGWGGLLWLASLARLTLVGKSAGQQLASLADLPVKVS